MYNLEEKLPECINAEGLASFVKRLGNPESTTLITSPCCIFQLPQTDGVCVFKLDAKAGYLNKFHPQFCSTFIVCKDNLTLVELLAIKQTLNIKL